MRILHCCLAAFYIDNYGYQENILPKMHKLQGHEVAILASTETYLENSVLGYVQPGSYYTADDIHITRVPYVRWLPGFLSRKLRIYEDINANVKKFNPDIIFLHDCQFISIIKIAAYAQKNKSIRIYIDGHTDFINSAKTWISKNILHKIIYKWCAKKIEPYTTKFYGTLPLRVDFFREVYGVPKEKTDLLRLGVDDTIINLSMRNETRKKIRMELNLTENDFVFVTGGKLDRRKNIHLLMRAIGELNIWNMKLVVFGTPNIEMKNEIDELAKSSTIRYLGWIPSQKTYDYFLAADVGFFPGTHSVLWEQAIGLGLPCVFKKWEGIQHVDLNGNCLFIDSSEMDEIKECILRLYNDSRLVEAMRKVALSRGISEFSYYEIAKKAIEN